MNERRALGELVVGSGVSAALGFVYLIYTGRLLGPVEYADVSAALALLYLFSMSFSPLSPTISRFVALYASRGETGKIVTLHGAIARRLMTGTGALAVVALACAVPIQRFLHFRSLWTVVLTVACVVSFVWVSVERAVLQGLSRFREYNVNAILETGVRLAGAVAVLAVARSAPFAFVSYVAGLVIASGLLRIRFSREWRSIPGLPIERGAIVNFAAPMIVLMIAFAVQQNADMLAAKRWLAPDAAGAYGAASGLARTFAVLSAPFFIFLVPRVTVLHDRGERIAPAVMRICGAFLAIAIVALAGFALLHGEIVRFSFGARFAAASALLVPLSILAVVTNLGLLLAQAFASAGRFAILRVYATGAAAEIVLLLFFHSTAAAIVWPVLALQSVVVALMAGAMLGSR